MEENLCSSGLAQELKPLSVMEALKLRKEYTLKDLGDIERALLILERNPDFEIFFNIVKRIGL